MLRRLLVGSAHYVVGPFGSDSDLRRHGQKIAAWGAKNAKETGGRGRGQEAGGALAQPVG